MCVSLRESNEPSVLINLLIFKLELISNSTVCDSRSGFGKGQGGCCMCSCPKGKTQQTPPSHQLLITISDELYLCRTDDLHVRSRGSPFVSLIRETGRKKTPQTRPFCRSVRWDTYELFTPPYRVCMIRTEARVKQRHRTVKCSCVCRWATVSSWLTID